MVGLELALAALNSFLTMGQLRPLFGLFLVFSNKKYNFTTNQCEIMYIQYTAQGFEPATFRT